MNALLNAKTPLYPDIQHEEKATIGLKYNTPKDITENDLRKEQGVNPRGDY
jgi:hypothetical protein